MRCRTVNAQHQRCRRPVAMAMGTSTLSTLACVRTPAPAGAVVVAFAAAVFALVARVSFAFTVWFPASAVELIGDIVFWDKT